MIFQVTTYGCDDSGREVRVLQEVSEDGLVVMGGKKMLMGEVVLQAPDGRTAPLPFSFPDGITLAQALEGFDKYAQAFVEENFSRKVLTASQDLIKP